MRNLTLAIALAAGGFAMAACERDIVSPDVAVAVALEGLPFPSVVVDDSLRDTSGFVVPVRAKAFNYLGEELPDLPFRYLILDRGATIDSLTGVVRGDSLRATPVRVVAFLDNLQTQTQSLAIVVQPDSLQVTAGEDTLVYSLTDTTLNVSRALSVRLLSAGPPHTPVGSWIVSFVIEYPTGGSLATIVNESGRESGIDTTAADGGAARRVRIRPIELQAASDSVVLMASARYRGDHVKGSPARLVLRLRPLVP